MYTLLTQQTPIPCCSPLQSSRHATFSSIPLCCTRHPTHSSISPVVPIASTPSFGFLREPNSLYLLYTSQCVLKPATPSLNLTGGLVRLFHSLLILATFPFVISASRKTECVVTCVAAMEHCASQRVQHQPC